MAGVVDERALAQKALDASGAVNLSGVVATFARVTSDLWSLARERGHGTNWVNTHPVSVIFASVISNLSGVDHSSSLVVIHAYTWAENIVNTPVAELSASVDDTEESNGSHLRSH